MLSLSKFIKKEIELRENLVGSGFLDAPPVTKTTLPNGKIAYKGDQRVTVLGKKTFHKPFFLHFSPFEDQTFWRHFPPNLLNLCYKNSGEIVSAHGFNSENTYIFYDTFVPDGWSFEEANE